MATSISSPAFPPSESSTGDFSPTRRSLLSRLKNWDDQQGWHEFMDRYGGFIFAIARRSGLQREEAEDVLQETLLSVAKKIPDFRYKGERGSFKAWLVMIVRSRIIDYLRKKYRRLPQARAGSINPDSGPGTPIEDRVPQPDDDLSHETIWQTEWENHLLETALCRVKERIPAKHYLAFRMCSQQQKSPAEVAGALGISLARVYLIRHRTSRMIAAEIARLRDGKCSNNG